MNHNFLIDDRGECDCGHFAFQHDDTGCSFCDCPYFSEYIEEEDDWVPEDGWDDDFE